MTNHVETQDASVAGEATRGFTEILALYHGFGRGAQRIEVIENCEFKLKPGKLTVMIGPSGCGKSTLAKLLAGYLHPDEGSLLIDGRHIAGPGKDRLMVFQESALFPWMVNEENALYGLLASGQVGAGARQRVTALMDRVGLGRFRHKYPGALSGGMQRRLEMVRALVNEPALFILDEPFRGLDAMTRTLMQEHFAQMFEEGRRTALFITTDIDEALLLADEILVMSSRPMKVTRRITVDVPRPRTVAGMIKDERMKHIKVAVTKALYSEAIKAFDGSSRAVAAAGFEKFLDTTQ